ncbi:SH3 domain-containing protein [Histidinibacterium aquaticum]|uniref:SH3 domain-containing protein n=1 Tax=Histidinibacterium aquaticum TaxID=2613962 RepID=A0A5J5GHB3_9RHOB|nr:SH3 domain-containing protein [Histidinibacterium aquaticum]KAA9006924.1 SH3 domain-containing protein [Histidinibacterium aquaticum]
MKHLLMLILLLVPATLAAQEFPARYSVSGVAADDTLNVRTGPGVDNAIIGEFTPDRTGIEVVRLSADGDWGQVNVNGQAGWVSMHYMMPLQQVGWNSTMSTVSSCFGTEPFWSARTTSDRQFVLENLGEPVFSAPAEPFVQSLSGPGIATAVEVPGGGFATLVVTAGACSDGMSDQQYGLNADMVTRLPGNGTQYWKGCCTVAVD